MVAVLFLGLRLVFVCGLILRLDEDGSRQTQLVEAVVRDDVVPVGEAIVKLFDLLLARFDLGGERDCF